jgi:uncharacterized protein (DUF1015 family)
MTEVDELIDSVTAQAPIYDLVADDGVGHTLWVVSDTTIIDRITNYFDAMPAIYIADGHHRSAAGSRVAASLGGDSNAMSSYFLSVMFPHDQMKILDYNRVVKDLGQLTSSEFADQVKQRFAVVEQDKPVSPAHAGEFGMYLDSQWYRLTIDPSKIPGDPVARLDVSLLADNLLEPVLGISDPRRDPRIDFVGGIRGLAELERRVDSGEMAVAFSMFPTSMEDLMAVADAQQVMPPKSTWFEPKLADGLVSHVLD